MNTLTTRVDQTAVDEIAVNIGVVDVNTVVIIIQDSAAENGGDKLVHGSGGISQPRAE